MTGRADIKTAQYYARGWVVFPCKPHTKQPATAHGFKDATQDTEQLKRLFATPHNIAMACGASGIVVPDFDTAKADFAGGELLALLLEQFPTITQDTPSNGVHLIYKQRPGLTLTNKRGKLPQGVDVRGDGGYILLAPSDVTYTDKDAADHGVPDGFNGTYRWRPGRGPHEIDAAVIPAFLIDMIMGPADKPKPEPHSDGKGDPLDDVIAEFNRTHTIVELLTANDYTLVKEGRDYARLARPDRDTSSVVVFKTETPERSYHHSTSDPLHTEDHARDAFDVWTQLQHDGDASKAYEAAKREQGKWTEAKTKGTPDMAHWMIDAPINDLPPLPAMHANGAFSADALQDLVDASIVTDAGPDGADDGADELPNPLSVAGVGDGLQLGWVDEYARLMTRLTGAPFEFNRLAGLVTVAAAIQRRAWLPMAFGDIYPNIYAAIIARSSVYHKSSALSKPRALLKRAMLDRLLLSELATSEGLLKQLAGQSSGVIFRDEIGTLFASHSQKHLVMLKPDLTALYDCGPYSRRLSNDSVKVDAPYLNILGATTPTRFYEGVSLTDWQDGFLARWLFVMPEGEPDFDAMTGLFTAQHDAELGALAVALVNIDRQPETPFTLAGNAHKRWDAWQRQAAKDAYLYGDDVIAAIVTRYAAYALKFAMILAAVNGSWGTVTEDTMQTAIALADSYKAGMGKLLAERNNYGISGAKLQKVFAVVKRKAGDKGATRKVVQQYTRLKASEAGACLDKLLDIGAIVETDRRFFAAAENLPIKAWK